MRTSIWGFTVVASFPWLAACGAESPGDLSGANDEPVGVATEPLDADGDHPVVALASAVGSGAGGDYILAIDTGHHLKESIVTSVVDGSPGYAHATPTFGSWTNIADNVKGVPTLAVFADTGAVDEFAWGTDGNLWEYFRDSFGGTVTAYNISTISGFGAISDSPLVVDIGDDSSQWAISVAVHRASDSAVFTLDYTSAMGWSAHKLLNGTGIVKNDNTIQGNMNLGINPAPGQPPYFAGRGISSSDSSSWVASRSHGSFGSSFSIVNSFSGSGSAPNVQLTGGAYVFARFGSQLKSAPVTSGALAWTVTDTCVVSGSPSWTAIRGTNNHLLVWHDDNHKCFDEGELLTSAPASFSNFLVYFRGNSGVLHAHEAGSTRGWGLGLSVP